MKKIFIYTYILLFFFSISGFAVNATDFRIGQSLQGKIKLSNMTYINLPKGAWTVIWTDYSFEKASAYKEISLIQVDDKKMRSFLKIDYPRDKGNGNGWRKGKNDACDDFSNQGSHFHKNTSRKSGLHSNDSEDARTDGISKGYCISIWNDELKNSNLDLIGFQNMEYFNFKNIDFPNSLTWIQQIYYSLNNRVKISYAYNELSNNKFNFKTQQATQVAKANVEKNILQFERKKLIDLLTFSDLHKKKQKDKENISNDLLKLEIVDKLKELKKMFDNDLISQKQYEQKSDKLLDDF
tara:strand:+ start:767 stop:1654 length:888 start_codon:yes stop_codon:yes gene_type:complete